MLRQWSISDAHDWRRWYKFEKSSNLGVHTLYVNRSESDVIYVDQDTII